MAEQIEQMTDREVVRQLAKHFPHLRMFHSLGWQCAGMVMEAMRMQGWRWTLRTWEGPGQRVACVFTSATTPVHEYNAIADTAPRAVCEAALKAKGVGDG